MFKSNRIACLSDNHVYFCVLFTPLSHLHFTNLKKICSRFWGPTFFPFALEGWVHFIYLRSFDFEILIKACWNSFWIDWFNLRNDSLEYYPSRWKTATFESVKRTQIVSNYLNSNLKSSGPLVPVNINEKNRFEHVFMHFTYWVVYFDIGLGVFAITWGLGS